MDDKLKKQESKNGRLDADALTNVHREYRDRIVQSITGFVRNQVKAEDIAAQAFQKAWEKREQFRGAASAPTWIQAIARNEARRSARHDGVVQIESLDEVDAREIPARGLITDHLEKAEDERRLQNALKQLPMTYRRVLTARFMEGLPIREIAGREHVPPGTVGSRIQKAKQLLRDALERPAASGKENREAPDPSIWDR